MADIIKIKLGANVYNVKDASAARKNVYYGTCTTAANTYKKVATVETFPLDGNGLPFVGTLVAIKYSNTNTYKTEGQTYQLNVNNTGDFPMYYNNAALATSTSANTLVAGYKNRHIYYMFNGSQWVWVTSSYDANTTYSGMTQAEVDAGTGTTARLITPQRLRDNFYTETEINNLLAAKANSADLATVATSGSYNDLTNKPTIPAAITVDSTITQNGTNPVQGGAIYTALQGKEDKQRVIVDIQCEINYPIGYSVGGNTITGAELYALCADPKKDVVLRIIGYDYNEDDDVDYSDDILYHCINDSLSEYEEQYYASWWNGMVLLVGLVIESEGANIYFDAGIEEFSYVPTSRTINNKPLSSDITLNASDVGAEDKQQMLLNMTYDENNNILSFTDIDNNTVSFSNVVSLLNNLNKTVVINYKDSLYYRNDVQQSYSTYNFVSIYLNRVYFLYFMYEDGDFWLEDYGFIDQQHKLVSGTNIKTINNKSLLGSGNLTASDIGALPSTTTIPTVPTNVSSFTNDAGYLTSHQDISGKADVVTIVTNSSTGSVSLALDPNKFYKFTGALTALTLTLNAGTGLCIYAGKFTAGTGFSNLSLPASVKEADGIPSIEAGNTYEFSIMDNLLLLVKEGS